MKQIAQNYRTGELALLDVPVPACRPGGILVRTSYSVISSGTEMMKISESKMSLLGKARARPDQVKKVVKSVQQQGLAATYRKVKNRLDAYTPLGYSLAGTVVEIGSGVSGVQVGQAVACAGNEYALHAEYNWVPANMFVPVPAGVGLDQAAFATIAAIALQSMRQAELHLGETACVIGLGLVGQILVRLLVGAGISVTGIDIVAERCRLAEAGGATASATLNGEGLDRLTQRIAQMTQGHGVDCVFLTAGGKDTRPVELAAELARDRARIVDVGKCRLDLPWNDYYSKELDVRFSRSYGAGRYDRMYEEGGVEYPIGYVRWTERRNLECIVSLLANGRLDLSPLISHVAPFTDAVETYRRMADGALGLGVLFRYREDQPIVRKIPGATRRRASAGAVRLGVIGAGNYASSMLLPHLVGDADVSLVEVATNSALSAANAARKFGFERCSTDAVNLLSARDIDAVLVATRHASHADLVCAALAAGKAVFVEKPLAIDRTQLRRIVRAIEESGNDRLMVGFNRRFCGLLKQLKQNWGERAEPHIVHYRINAGPLEKGSWYLQTDTEGSRFIGEGGHFIDAVNWWLDAEPVRVSAAALPDDNDNLAATVHYSDGSVATIDYLTHADPGLAKEQIEFFGEGKAGRLDNFTQFELWRTGRATRQKARLDKGQAPMLKAFISAVKSGAPMPIPLASLIATTAATLAVQCSVRRGTPVPLDDFLRADEPTEAATPIELAPAQVFPMEITA